MTTDQLVADVQAVARKVQTMAERLEQIAVGEWVSDDAGPGAGRRPALGPP